MGNSLPICCSPSGSTSCTRCASARPNRTGRPIKDPIFAPSDEPLRWSRFEDREAGELYKLFRDIVSMPSGVFKPKEVAYEAVEYDPPLKILDELETQEAEIQRDLRELREMVRSTEVADHATH